MKSMRTLLLVLFVVGMTTHNLLGAGNIWWEACDDNWFVVDNWFPVRLPLSDDTVYIDSGCGGPQISTGDAVGETVYVGYDLPDNTLTLSGTNTTLTATELILGEFEGSAGIITMGGLSEITAGQTIVGNNGTGEIVLNNGTLRSSGYLDIGVQPTAQGTLEMNGGSINSYIRLGDKGGTGIFRQNGGTVTNTVIYMHGGNSQYELHDPGEIIPNSSILLYNTYGPSSFLQTGGNCSPIYILLYTENNYDDVTYTLEGGNLTIGTYAYAPLKLSGSNLHQEGGMALFNQSGGHNNVTGNIKIHSGIYNLSGTGELSAVDEILDGRISTKGIMVQTGGINTLAGNLQIGNSYHNCYQFSHNPTFGRYELGGGQLSVGGDEFVGCALTVPSPCPESRGDFLQTGGTHTVTTLYIGNKTPGSYIQSEGTTAVETFLYLATSAGVKGEYEISGGELSSYKASFGHEGIGEFTHSGGMVTFNDLDIGKLPNSAGSYELSGEGALVVEDRLLIGRSGTGTFTLNGGALSANILLLGRYSGVGGLNIADASSEIIIGENLTLGPKAVLEAVPGSLIYLTKNVEETNAASFYNLSQNPSNVYGLNNLELSFEGGSSLTATMELGGNDYGSSESGFLANFALDTLQVGTEETTAHVILMDETDNGNGGPGNEVLYVGSIMISEGSTLDLNSCKVYFRSLCNKGTIILNGGSLEFLGTPGDSNSDGKVDMLDLYELCQRWLTPACGDPECDFNWDGYVDINDYYILASAWLETKE